MAKKSMPVEQLKASKSKKPIPVKIVNDAPSYVKEDRKYRAEDDLRVLQRAKEIEGDKSRMKEVKAIAKEQLKALKDVC